MGQGHASDATAVPSGCDCHGSDDEAGATGDASGGGRFPSEPRLMSISFSLPTETPGTVR